MWVRLRNVLTVLRGLALAALIPDLRRVWTKVRNFERGLPELLRPPLSEALAAIRPARPDLRLPADQLRLLCDTAALLDRRSPLGLCLRRSMVRYHFLSRAGLPLVLQFGARFKDGRPDRDVTGHAWVALDGRPYFEDGENYRGFTVMLRYPPPEE